MRRLINEVARLVMKLISWNLDGSVNIRVAQIAPGGKGINHVHIGNTPTELLAASRDIIYIRIRTLTAMLQDFSGALDVNFAEFTRAELMVLIQLRRMFIDEMARR